MTNRLFISDLHINHEKIIQEMGRTQFSCIEEHDEYIIDNINNNTSPSDILYIGGDIVMNTNENNISEVVRRTIGRINCNIYLALGNHDTDRKIREYYKHVKRLQMCYEFKDFVFCHFPIHESQLDRFGFCVHGHLHSNSLPDKRYINVSCEAVNYKPIDIQQIRKNIEDYNNGL